MDKNCIWLYWLVDAREIPLHCCGSKTKNLITLTVQYKDDCSCIADTQALRNGGSAINKSTFFQEHDHHYLAYTPSTLLSNLLTKSDTNPDIIRILIRSIRTFLTGGTPTLNWSRNDHIANIIKEAFQEQTKIGWKHIFLGRLSMKWKYTQQQHFASLSKTTGQPIPKSKTAQSWSTNLCKRLMFIALNQWQIRNEAYHDSTSKYAYNRDRLRLISDVTTRYFETKPDHFAIARLMSNPLEDLIRQLNKSIIKSWKKSYDLVLKFLKPSLITSYLG